MDVTSEEVFVLMRNSSLGKHRQLRVMAYCCACLRNDAIASALEVRVAVLSWRFHAVDPIGQDVVERTTAFDPAIPSLNG